MVSEKTIVILLTIAIILSIFSVVVTISSVNTKMVPDTSLIKSNIVPSQDSAQVGIIVNTPVQNP